MKILKNFIVCIMICVGLFSSTLNVSAETLSQEKNNDIYNSEYIKEAPSETFIDFYSSFFADKENFEIYDNIGNIITDAFYNEAYKFYESNDYAGLKDYVLNNGIAGGCQENITATKETRAFKTDYVHKRYFYNVNKHPAAGELEYYIDGTYSWDITTGKIASHSGGSIDITLCNFGAAWSHTTDNMTGDASISGDGYSVTFRGSFHLVVTLGFDLGGFPVGWEVDCGSYSGSATATGHV